MLENKTIVKFFIFAIFQLWILGQCFAGISKPLYIGNSKAILDEYGRKMGDGNLIELKTSEIVSIKVGKNAMDGKGVFCEIFPQRIVAGTKIAARAYNAKTKEGASFYADSYIAIAPPSSESYLVLEFGPTTPIDLGDKDSDGLINSWEKSLGTYDTDTNDYDGDGVSDHEEWRAGTNLKDPSSLFKFTAITKEGPEKIKVSWQSVPSKKYRLEFIPSLEGEQIFVQAGEDVVADTNQYSVSKILSVPMDSRTRYFRVRIID